MSELNERQVVASITAPEHIIQLANRHVRADDFIFHREKFEFYVNYFKTYKSIPSSRIISDAFEDWSDPALDENAFEYYIDQLKKDSLERKITETIEQQLEAIKADPKAAVKQLSAQFSKLSSNFESDVSYTDRDALRRLELYEQRRQQRKTGKITGVPTGLSYFDEKGMGWGYGELVSIVGNTWIGKSWILLYMAARAYIAGHRVLLVSCEMTREAIEPRIDTLIANARKMRIPYNSIRFGQDDVRESYEDHLKWLSKAADWITADSLDLENFDVGDIVAYTDKYKPDVVFIDGLEFLQDKSTSRNRAGWEEVKSIIRQAKLLATSRNVVVVCTAQARRTEDDRMPTKKDVAYSYDIVRASDYVVALAKGLEEDEDEEKIRYYTVQKERNGEGLIKRMKLAFDPGGGFIGEINDDELQRPQFEFSESFD